MVRGSLAAAFALCLCGTALADPPRLVTASYSVRTPTTPRAEPTIHGRVEGAAGGVYGGLRAATLDRQEHEARFDIYLGLRPDIGPLSVDLAYTRRMDETGGGCCGAVALSLGRPFGEGGALSARLNLDSVTETALTEAQASMALPRDYRIRGSISSRFSTRDLSADPRLAVDLGASRAITDSVTVNLRFQEASQAPGRAALSLNVKF